VFLHCSSQLSKDILAHASPRARKFFHLLEETDAIKCYPANLAAEARSLLSTLPLQLGNDYGSKLRKLMILRVLKKVKTTIENRQCQPDPSQHRIEDANIFFNG
jgi:hypothetical protein